MAPRDQALERRPAGCYVEPHLGHPPTLRWPGASAEHPLDLSMQRLDGLPFGRVGLGSAPDAMTARTAGKFP